MPDYDFQPAAEPPCDGCPDCRCTHGNVSPAYYDEPPEWYCRVWESEPPSVRHESGLTILDLCSKAREYVQELADADDDEREVA